MEKKIAPNFTKSLELLYGEREARSILRLYREERGEITESDAKRLLNSEPIQYILNNAHFWGREFYVTPATLIPRGETEELVQNVIQRLGENFDGTILDIGTGSGVIAISLALELPHAKITAMDISSDAIDVAIKNAEKFGANVDFQVKSLFDCDSLSYDIIVSNPPYVTDSERKDMHENVLKWEPQNALFVPDNDPLIFYREIAKRSKGILFFEINEQFGEETKKMLTQEGYKDILIIKDLHDRDRICTANPQR